jgi:hypothetical protein
MARLRWQDPLGRGRTRWQDYDGKTRDCLALRARARAPCEMQDCLYWHSRRFSNVKNSHAQGRGRTHWQDYDG